MPNVTNRSGTSLDRTIYPIPPIDLSSIVSPSSSRIATMSFLIETRIMFVLHYLPDALICNSCFRYIARNDLTSNLFMIMT